MEILNFDEWLYANEVNEDLFSSVVYDSLTILDEGYSVYDLGEYLYNTYGINLNEDELAYDIELALYEAETGDPSGQEHGKPVGIGTKIGDHFHKHWPKYAAGAGIATGLGVGGYYGNKYLKHRKSLKRAIGDEFVGPMPQQYLPN